MFIYEGIVDGIATEDGGQAIIATICSEKDEESGLFFRLQSWEEAGHASSEKEFEDIVKAGHLALNSIGLKEGTKVRITLKILDNE